MLKSTSTALEKSVAQICLQGFEPVNLNINHIVGNFDNITHSKQQHNVTDNVVGLF